ncbi:MAG TPA: hypothetical protein VIX17_02240 [Pyrinomonadaceae bacterium]|jgi:hypothetical protein
MPKNSQLNRRKISHGAAQGEQGVRRVKFSGIRKNGWLERAKSLVHRSKKPIASD